MQNNSEKTTTTSDSGHKADPIEFTRSLAALSDKRIDILRRIKETGSISEAARASGVSYKAAWQALETLENLAGGKLVEKLVGGKLVEKLVGGNRGGGTTLTVTGEQILKIADRIAQARSEVLRSFTDAEQPLANHLTTSGILSSMRNNLPCVVENVKHGSALVRVFLRLDEENIIKASVTAESAQLLGLKPGVRMIAAAKATAVEIAKSFPDANLDNRLTGRVVRCTRSEKGGEVALRLPSGLIVIGFAKHNHHLAPGMEAQATVASNAVVIARMD